MTVLKQAVLKIFETELQKITPLSLENRMVKNFKAQRKHVRETVKTLLEEGELVYTYNLGHSFLEKSFNRPVRISDRVILKPAGMFFDATADDVVISLDHGASFGTGAHPSTRLSIRAIEFLTTTTSLFSQPGETVILDIGTGSGVLALTALKFGINRALATDIDPCARDEACKNARLNDLYTRFKIYEGDLASLKPSFNLVCANLRFPTLINICGEIDRLCRFGSCLVFSGVRKNEFDELSENYKRYGFHCLWQSVELDWAGGAFIREMATKGTWYKKIETKTNHEEN